jgi:hypothetical protein
MSSTTRSLAIITVLTLLTIAPATAQDSSTECEQLREIHEDMQEKADAADTREEKLEVVQNYREETRGLAEECSRSIEIENSSEQEEPQEETSEGYSVPDYNVELTESQFESLRERMVENITEAKQNPSEHFPEACLEEGKQQIEYYRGNISEADSMEQVMELNSEFTEKRDKLKENCGKQQERPQTSNSSEDIDESTDNSLEDIELPEPGETLTENKISEIREKYTEMRQQIQELKERNRELNQTVQTLKEDSSEPANKTGETQKNRPENRTEKQNSEQSEAENNESQSNKSGNRGGGLLNQVAQFFLG